MAERLCTRVGIVHKGELVAEGALDELKGNLAMGGSLEEIFLEVTRPDGSRGPDASAEAIP
jgi:ABC-2 type transport system ATP-binding protein